jgi:hypothetical protein
MNINNIKVGEVYKNYKVLCEVLEDTIKAGKGKKLQLKEWERYFEYNKQGHSFMITNIYKTPKEKEDMRKGGNNKTNYIEQIEKLILDLLVQAENGQVFLSKNRLLQTLQMVNENYSFGKYKPIKLSKHTNITKEEIKDFYEISDGLLQRNLEAALKSLRSQALIMWHSTLTVGFIDTYIDRNIHNEVKATKQETTDADGDMKITFDVAEPVKTITHRKATKEEQEIILHTEREYLKKYKCKTVQDVFKKGINEQFYKEVNNRLFDDHNIYLYYNSYEIIYNEDHVFEEWKELEAIKQIQEEDRNVTHKELNNSIIKKLNTNAKHRHIKAFGKFEETNKEKYKIRMNNDYIENNKILTDTLINRETKSIE